MRAQARSVSAAMGLLPSERSVATGSGAVLRSRRRRLAVDGIVRLSCRDQKKLEAGTRDYAAATAFCHSLAASARKVRSVDRETRWR